MIAFVWVSLFFGRSIHCCCCCIIFALGVRVNICRSITQILHTFLCNKQTLQINFHLSQSLSLMPHASCLSCYLFCIVLAPWCYCCCCCLLLLFPITFNTHAAYTICLTSVVLLPIHFFVCFFISPFCCLPALFALFWPIFCSFFFVGQNIRIVFRFSHQPREIIAYICFGLSLSLVRCIGYVSVFSHHRHCVTDFQVIFLFFSLRYAPLRLSDLCQFCVPFVDFSSILWIFVDFCFFLLEGFLLFAFILRIYVNFRSFHINFPRFCWYSEILHCFDHIFHNFSLWLEHLSKHFLRADHFFFDFGLFWLFPSKNNFALAISPPGISHCFGHFSSFLQQFALFQHTLHGCSSRFLLLFFITVPSDIGSIQK